MLLFQRLIAARRFVRKMRGGAQAHLLEAEDGHHYVVKFQNNPQHRRILVSETVAHVLLRYLGLTVPEMALVHITDGFLRANPEVFIALGSRRLAVEPGLHWGSRHPGHPDRTIIYDFLPEPVLRTVLNLREFPGMLVFDKWIGNADGRQCIFHRALIQGQSTGPAQAGLVAQMIDNGFALGGAEWVFRDSPIQGLYPRLIVYESVRSLSDFEPWLKRVHTVKREVLRYAFRHVPREWLAGDESHSAQLISRLLTRAERIPDLIDDTRRCSPAPFPNWHA